MSDRTLTRTPSAPKLATRALIQRINRKLAADGKQLKATRGESARRNFGDYYVLSGRNHVVVYPIVAGRSERHLTLEEYGRDLGVLQPWETLAEG